MTASPAPTLRFRLLVPRLALLAFAVALGLILQRVVAGRLEEIQALASEDVLRARAELAALLRIGGASLFGFVAATGLAIGASARRTRARAGLVLGAILIACSAAGGGLVWYMASVLLACRAR